MCYACACGIPMSRYNFIEDTPFRLVRKRLIAIAHDRGPMGDYSITVPVLTEKNLRQGRHLCGMVGWVV